jgi:disulfide bond formation protein DsbB
MSCKASSWNFLPISLLLWVLLAILGRVMGEGWA